VTGRADTGTSRDEDATAATKHAARIDALARRNRLSPAERKSASAAATSNLLGLQGLTDSSVVLAYFALPSEIDPCSGISALRRRGATIVYPRVESDGVLGVHVVDDELELLPGPFGLSEPSAQAVRADLHLVDAVVVPAVAFDLLGMRLGYGGGYYDRLLPGLRSDCLRIGLAFDEQIVAELPAEKHDEAVDVVVTPTRVIRPAKARIS
jgi:5-formyltetrahydrofolate cyclo-ligase